MSGGSGGRGSGGTGLNWGELSALLAKAPYRTQCAVSCFLIRSGMSQLLSVVDWAPDGSVLMPLLAGGEPVTTHPRHNQQNSASNTASNLSLFHRQQPTFLYYPGLGLAKPYYDDAGSYKSPTASTVAAPADTKSSGPPSSVVADTKSAPTKMTTRGWDPVNPDTISQAITQWRTALNQSWQAVRDEYLALRKSTAAGQTGGVQMDRIESNVASTVSGTTHDHTSGSWQTYYLLNEGRWMDDHCARAPLTTKLLKSLPVCAGNAIGYAYFSVLSPNTQITPHFGVSNLKLRAHLPLIVPSSSKTAGSSGAGSSNCFLAVAGEARPFKPGETIIFDDSFEHRVWFESDAKAPTGTGSGGDDSKFESDRVVLLIDLWHPALTSSEIELINRCLGPAASGGGAGSAAGSGGGAA